MAVSRRKGSLLVVLLTLLTSTNTALGFSLSSRTQLKANCKPVGVTQFRASFAVMKSQPQRRSKTERKHSLENTNEEKTTDQLALVPLYRGVAMMHFGQILLMLKKTGLTLGSLNVVGGSLVASGITYMLGNAAEKNYLENDTFKRLNGLMFIYAAMAFLLVALVPQLHGSLGMLYFLSASTTIFVSVKGYLSGLKADSGKGFFKETARLFNEAFQVTLSLTNIPQKHELCDFASLWAIALKKISLTWAIAHVMFSSGLSRSQIAPKISQVMKLTILGGSIVTNISINDDSVAQKVAFFPLNVLTCYVLTTMAAFGIATASTPLQIIEGMLLVFCSVLSILKSFRSFYLFMGKSW